MGLDTSHDCWHGAYSAFTRWRQTVAEVAGYAVWPVRFDGGPEQQTVMLDWGHITPANLFGEWERTPDDPLVVLIAHSDCEGVIHPEQAGPLADRLEGLLPALEARGIGAGHIERAGGYIGATRRFIDGLRRAVATGEDVTFS